MSVIGGALRVSGLSLVLASLPVPALDYYVSDQFGSDSASGTSPSTAWQTLEKVSAHVFQAGDRVHFRCGDTWRGELKIKASGTETAPITYTSYGGDCANDPPVFLGSRRVEQWELVESNGDFDLYMADLNAECLPFGHCHVPQITIDGSYRHPARYPNAGYTPIELGHDDLNPNYDPDVPGPDDAQAVCAPDDVVDRGYFLDTSLTVAAPGLYPGADVYIRTSDFRVERYAVSSFDLSSGRVCLKAHELDQIPRTGIAYRIKKDHGYYLAGQVWMIDTPYEWSFDRSENTLYLAVPSGQQPSSMAVEASISDVDLQLCVPNVDPPAKGIGIAACFRNHLKIEGLELRNFAKHGISMRGHGITIDDVEIDNTGDDGITFSTVANEQSAVITNSRIRNTTNNGIEVHGFGYSMVRRTIVEGIGIGRPMWGFPSGISAYSNLEAISNVIRDTASSGIMYRCPGDALTTIAGNTIYDACLESNDCGAIYTSDRSRTLPPGALSYSKNNANQLPHLIAYNRVKGVPGNLDGLPGHHGVHVSGIYLDDYAHHVYVLTNTLCESANRGLFLHNANHIFARSNVFEGNGASIWFQEDPAATLSFDNNHFWQNLVLQFNGTPLIRLRAGNLLRHGSGQPMAEFQENIYAHPEGSDLVYESFNTSPNSATQNYFDFAQWQALRQQDLGSIDYAHMPAPGERYYCDF